MGKQLVNFITCGCESSAPFFCNLQSRARTHAVLVIGLYELLDNPTTEFIEPSGPYALFGQEVSEKKILSYRPNRYKELFMAAMLVNRLGRNEQFL
jgi:hypothetical protein